MYLAVHRDRIASMGSNFRVVIHAKPRHLTYLSHIPNYLDQTYLNRHLLRWQPGTIINLPEGVGFVPFNVPGSQALMSATLKMLHQYRVIGPSMVGWPAPTPPSSVPLTASSTPRRLQATSTWIWSPGAAAKVWAWMKSVPSAGHSTSSRASFDLRLDSAKVNFQTQKERNINGKANK